MSNEAGANTGGGFSLLKIFKYEPDKVIVGREQSLESRIAETGADRLRRMFSIDDQGEMSKEMTLITQCLFATTLGGGVIGGIVESRKTFVDFLENNQATKFRSQLEAKRELQRVMSLSIARGLCRWGSRIGLFSVMFTTVMTSVSVYRGKDSVLEYIAAGGLTGALFRMSLGLKGAFAGGLVGSALGGIGGGASLLVLKLAGISMDDLRDFAKTLKDDRQEAIAKKTAESLESEEPILSAKMNVEHLTLDNIDVDGEQNEK